MDRRDELAREYDIAPTCYCPTAPSSKWRNANHTTLRNSVRFAPSTNACASIPIPNRTRCSNGTRRFNAKSNRACGRTSSRTRSPLPPSEWPDVDGGAARRHESQSASAPKSIRVWKERYPERLQVLNRVRKAVSQIAEDTRTPVEIVIKPQYLRNLCWTDELVSVTSRDSSANRAHAIGRSP